MTDWGDCVARVRGLATHLLTPAQRRALDAADGGPALHAVLGPLLGLDPAAVADPERVEAETRRVHGERLAVLEHWAGPRSPTLAALLEGEDRRSIRAMLRGASAGVPSASRLAGLLPTRRLPRRALERLATLDQVPAVVALLAAWQHPLAPALQPGARAEAPDLAALEQALLRAWAARARHEAGRDPHLRLLVAREVDAANVVTVLALEPSEQPVAAWLLVDGDRTRDLARAPCAATEWARWLAPRLAGTPLATLLSAAPGRELAFALALEREFRDRARAAPVSSAPLVHFVLRLRADGLCIRRAAWGVALGIPPARRLMGTAA